MRFPEFSGEWKKYSFNDIAQYKKGPFGSALKKEIFVPKSADSVKIYEQQNAIKKDWELGRYYISRDYFINHMQQFIVEAGDIIVSCAGTIGEIYELPPNAVSGVFNQALMRVRINATLIDKNIFIKVFSSMIDSFSKIYSNGSAIKNIPPFADLKKTNVFLPTQNEQYKISRLISLLDERIATQNKIIDKLQSLIKGISNKIFATIQGIEYRMGNIVTISNGNSNVQDAVTESKDGLYPFFDRSENIKYLPTFLFDKEAIIYPGEGAEFMPRYFRGKFALHQRCYAIFDFKEIINAQFLYFYLKTQNSYFVRNAVGSTVPSLRLDTFQKLKVIIPPKKIQHSVSLYLSSMEQKCNVEKDILQKLLKQKQYLLRQMFI